MPNGKIGDNPLSDLVIHGRHPFPADIEEVLLRIDALGKEQGWWPLGENWPYSPREFEWEKGEDLEGARQAVSHLLDMMESGRGAEALLDPGTGDPLGEGPRQAQ